MPTPAPPSVRQEPTTELIPGKISSENGEEWSIFYVDHIWRQTHVQKYFKAPNIKVAEEIARKYCLATRTKFVRVWPFLVDLEAETQAALNQTGFLNETHHYQLSHGATVKS